MTFDQYTEKANEFVEDVARELKTPDDTDHAYKVMTSFFHTIREILSPEESLHLIAKLPLYLKAVYINGWHLNNTHNKMLTTEEFIQVRLATVRESTRHCYWPSDVVARFAAADVIR